MVKNLVLLSVEALLAELAINHIPLMRVFNKADRVESAFAERICRRLRGVAISALDTRTFSPLLQEIEEMIWGKKEGAKQTLPLGRRGKGGGSVAVRG